MNIRIVHFKDTVYINGEARVNIGANEDVSIRYSTGSRGPGIEIWFPDDSLIFIPMSNIRYVRETK